VFPSEESGWTAEPLVFDAETVWPVWIEKYVNSAAARSACEYASAQVAERDLVAAVGEDRHVPGPLHGLLEPALVLRAQTGHAARNDLPALGDEAGEELAVAPLDLQSLVREERIDLALATPLPALAASIAIPVPITVAAIAIATIAIASVSAAASTS
jgi:hypothetical protein